MAVIVEDTIEIVVSNALLTNNVTIVNPSLRNTISVSQGYVAVANSGGDDSDNVDEVGVTQITAGEGLSGGVITTYGTISLPDVNPSPGVYLNANITIDEKGRVVQAANGQVGGGGGGDGSGITSLQGVGPIHTYDSNSGDNVITSSGQITMTRELSHPHSEDTIYTNPIITASDYGIITSIESGPPPGEPVLTENIYVTNVDNGFSHIYQNHYNQGTLIEDVLRAVLEPYVSSSITFLKMSFSIENPDGSFGLDYYRSAVYTLVEVGTTVRVSGVEKSVTFPYQVHTLDLYLNDDLLESGISAYSDQSGLNEIYEETWNYVKLSTYQLKGLDTGNPGFYYPLVSLDKHIWWRYRAKVGYDPLGTPQSDTDAQYLWDNMGLIFNELAYDDFPVLETSEGNNLQENFTYVIYPKAWGFVESILEGAVNVITDFDSPYTFNIVNGYGISVVSYIYKTTNPGAFSAGSPLTINI